MKPKSEDMKKLNDVIEEMIEEWGIELNHLDVCEKWMRLACEAMAKEIVPEEKVIWSKVSILNVDNKSYNACRDEIIKKIARFMGEKI